MSWLKKLKEKLFNGDKTSKKVLKLDNADINQREAEIKELEISRNLEVNLDNIKSLFGNSYDLAVRRVSVGPKEQQGALVYLDGLIGSEKIENIIQSLNIDLLKIPALANSEADIYQIAVEKLLNNKGVSETSDLAKVLKDLASGYTALLFAGTAKVILCETQDFETRQIEEPEAEIVLRGPRDGFVEEIQVNTSLLRRRLRIPHLWIEEMELGELSKTTIALAYIKGLASEGLIKEVKSRLERIEIDNILESGYIQEYIVDQPFTVFPVIKRTERTDRVVSCLVEGKVAILTDGTPFVLVAPTTYNSLLQAPDDYNEIFPIGSFIRMMRHFSFLISLLLPGIYVAVINFHRELLPVSLLLRITATREGIPFPVVLEGLLMETLFEVLREAGLRLPKSIGAAISIVGALILGDAAVAAGLVSPSMVIVVALTAIASFTIPDYSLSLAIRILRFSFLILGATVGLFGIQFGLLIMLTHLVSLRSFGQPYFQPYGPVVWSDLKDSIVRVFWWKQTARPKLFKAQDDKRQPKGQKPKPPKD